MFENCWVLVLVAVGVLGPLASINLKITISSNPPPKKKKPNKKNCMVQNMHLDNGTNLLFHRTR